MQLRDDGTTRCNSCWAKDVAARKEPPGIMHDSVHVEGKLIAAWPLGTHPDTVRREAEQAAARKASIARVCNGNPRCPCSLDGTCACKPSGRDGDGDYCRDCGTTLYASTPSSGISDLLLRAAQFIEDSLWRPGGAVLRDELRKAAGQFTRSDTTQKEA